jgi:hypothetical protein
MSYPATSTMRKALFVAAFALLYMALTLWVMVAPTSATLSGFEPGEPRASQSTIQFLGILSQALMFPLVSLFASHGAPWPLTWLLMFGNGVLWAVVIVALWSAVRRRAFRRASESPIA